ncbi:hypothetical protein [Nocardia sp. SC052]|uniref:DUF7694 domain-containing protein n=1 Tax=Nocardia sichangensis TaxID=3385975 RepID=UPI0039A15E6A
MTTPAPTTVNALKLRAVLGKSAWSIPQRFGTDGWAIARLDKKAGVIVSAFDLEGGSWIHASIAHYDQTMPSYDELALLHRAVFGRGWAYQIFAPPASHVNIHEYTLHLWGRVDGAAMLPDFGAAGTI